MMSFGGVRRRRRRPAAGALAAVPAPAPVDEPLPPNTYLVDRILDGKEVRGKMYYLIKWLGFDDKENSWEPEENLDSCTLPLEEFRQRRLLERLSLQPQQPSIVVPLSKHNNDQSATAQPSPGLHPDPNNAGQGTSKENVENSVNQTADLMDRMEVKEEPPESEEEEGEEEDEGNPVVPPSSVVAQSQPTSVLVRNPLAQRNQVEDEERSSTPDPEVDRNSSATEEMKMEEDEEMTEEMETEDRENSPTHSGKIVCVEVDKNDNKYFLIQWDPIDGSASQKLEMVTAEVARMNYPQILIAYYETQFLRSTRSTIRFLMSDDIKEVEVKEEDDEWADVEKANGLAL